MTDHRYSGGIKRRPDLIAGYTRRVDAPEGRLNLTVNSDADGPLEVFVNVGKAGSDVTALAEAIGRLVSLVLRLDCPLSQQERLDEVARRLRGIGGSRATGFGARRVRSLPDAIAYALERHYDARGEVARPDEEESLFRVERVAEGAALPAPAVATTEPLGARGMLCPECGNATLYASEGCNLCLSCGYSAC